MADTPPVATRPASPPAATVTDHRPVPRGVMPRGVQTWVMAGVAVFMLAIMLIVGRPDPPARPASAAAPAMPPSADRVRDYQERMRLLEAQALQDAQAAAGAPLAAPPVMYQEPQPAAPQDPIVAERRRREYESLFASNVVLSRRPENERPDIGRPSGAAALPRTDPANPSVEEVADAVVRATTRVGGLAASPVAPQA